MTEIKKFNKVVTKGKRFWNNNKANIFKIGIGVLIGAFIEKTLETPYNETHVYLIDNKTNKEDM